MPDWRYMVVEIVAVKITRRDDEASLSPDREGSRDSERLPVHDVEGWRVKGDPNVWSSIEDVLNHHGRWGWELVSVMPANTNGISALPVYELRAFFKAPD